MPAHDKTDNKTCVISKDLDQHVQPSSMARGLVYPSLDSPEAIESTCDQQTDQTAQADPSLRWSQKFYCRFCRALAQMYY